jgi:hypothetical protein
MSIGATGRGQHQKDHQNAAANQGDPKRERPQPPTGGSKVLG